MTDEEIIAEIKAYRAERRSEFMGGWRCIACRAEKPFFNGRPIQFCVGNSCAGILAKTHAANKQRYGTCRPVWIPYNRVPR